MRERRSEYLKNPELIDEILLSGTEKAKKVAGETLAEVSDAMHLNYFEE